jgi:hypothetical protein
MDGIRCTCDNQCSTFGACLRRKGIRIGWCRSAAGYDLSAEKANRAELDLYKSARLQGVQPTGTRTDQIRFALDESDRRGTAFDAGKVPSLG